MQDQEMNKPTYEYNEKKVKKHNELSLLADFRAVKFNTNEHYTKFASHDVVK